MAEQDIITLPLLEGTDGAKKMSKSLGNYISLIETPAQMYGKIMSLPDELMWKYFNLLTNLSLKEIEELKERKQKFLISPRDVKARLAKEIVRMYHGEKEAQRAEDEFDRVFRSRELPSDMPVFETDKKEYFILDLLCDIKLAASKNEAKRLVEAGAVDINNSTEREWKKSVKIKDGMIIKVGNRKFIKIHQVK